MTTQSALREKLVGSPIYQPLRFLYQSAFDRAAIRRRDRRRDFYRQFLRRGEVVFDVGANLGNYAEAYLRLGARVVAIEPDPRNLQILRRRFHGNSQIFIEACAAGATNGTAQLHLADRDDVSTLSADWMNVCPAAWQGAVDVPVRTIDSLAGQYGSPAYVKVDVEGFDCEALRGMTFTPRCVSFEFNPLQMSVAKNCIALFPHAKFNYVVEEHASFASPEWLTADALLARLSDLPTDVHYGDVFMRPTVETYLARTPHP